MNINSVSSLLQPYEGGILLALVFAVGYLIFSHRTLKQSIDRHDTEQRELRGLVIGIIQSIGDIKGDIGDMKGDIKLLMASQQTKTGNTPSES